jgi:hypothetical protein
MHEVVGEAILPNSFFKTSQLPRKLHVKLTDEAELCQTGPKQDGWWSMKIRCVHLMVYFQVGFSEMNYEWIFLRRGRIASRSLFLITASLSVLRVRRILSSATAQPRS